MRSSIFYILIVSIFFTSCGEEDYFLEYKSLKDQTWNVNDTLEFDIEIDDENAGYNIYVNIRNTKDYVWSNMYMHVITEAPSGKEVNHRKEFRLFDEQGKWTGKNSGTLVDNSFLTYEKWQFPEKGTYKIYLVHGMYDEDLTEISDIGIKVEKISN